MIGVEVEMPKETVQKRVKVLVDKTEDLGANEVPRRIQGQKQKPGYEMG